MLRHSSALAVLIAALTPLMTVLAYGQPRPAATNLVTPQTISEKPSNTTMPICYIQLENGQLRDLRQLCGRKSNSPEPPRSVQRSVQKPSVQLDSDSDEDESAARATPRSQRTTPPTPTGTPSPTTPSPATTPSPTNSTPQPSASPVPRLPDRPTNAQPVPTTLTPSSAHPLAIPQERD